MEQIIRRVTRKIKRSRKKELLKTRILFRGNDEKVD
jgi:hypothetical protein